MIGITDNPGQSSETASTILLKNRINARLAIVCMAAASVGLSMAIISIAKLFLLIFGLAALLWNQRTARAASLLAKTCTPMAALLAFFAFGLSLLWTVAPQADALGSVAKYGKLTVIAMMMFLIRDRREAMYALGAFALAQLFLLLSSWGLYAHLPLPWATSNMALTDYAVFSSYLDQGIISAVFAAICWHLRCLAPGRLGRSLAVLVAFLALANVFFVLKGRSGHVVAIALLSLAIMWELPKRYRPVVILLPFLLALGLYASSPKVRERLSMAASEVQSYSSLEEPVTSSGIRLNFWHRAVQIIGQHPLGGAGVGSWSTEYNRLQRAQNPQHSAIDGNGNPHQEYLLWGVQLGIPGLLLFIGLQLCLLRDSARMQTPYARATQSALLALAVACFFNASIYDAQIGDFFCVLLGLLLALGLSQPLHQAAAFPPHEQAT